MVTVLASTPNISNLKFSFTFDSKNYMSVFRLTMLQAFTCVSQIFAVKPNNSSDFVNHK